MYVLQYILLKEKKAERPIQIQHCTYYTRSWIFPTRKENDRLNLFDINEYEWLH